MSSLQAIFTLLYVGKELVGNREDVVIGAIEALGEIG